LAHAAYEQSFKEIRIHRFPFSHIPISHTFFPLSPKNEKSGADAATVLPAYIQVLQSHEERVKMSEHEVPRDIDLFF
jgi:hypothetical protein